MNPPVTGSTFASTIYSSGGPVLQGRIDSGGGSVIISVGDSVRQRILNWISSLRFNDKQADVAKRVQPNTGQWFIATTEFQQWLHGEENTTLWCPGIPGAGKTSMVSIMIDYFVKNLEENIGVAYVYCDYKNREKQTARNLISSLTLQLVRKCPEIPREVSDLYESCTEDCRSPSLDEHVALFLEVSRGFRKTFVIIDALDECSEIDNEDDQTDDKFISAVQMLESSVHLLVTSRPNNRIQQAFEAASRVDILASNSDIREYLACRMTGSSQLAKIVNREPTLKDDIMTAICENSKGIFLLAHLQMGSLANQTSPRNIRKALLKMPTTLSETYEDSLRRINGQCFERSELAMQVLAWVCCARRPLFLKELHHALAVQPGDTFFDESGLHDTGLLESVCIGLVVIDNDKYRTVRLVHSTLQEYLDTVRGALFEDVEVEISRICLTYLSFNVFEEGPCGDNEALEKRLQRYPFIWYASCFWGDHLRGDPEEVVTDLVLGFLRNERKVSSAVQVLYISYATEYGTAYDLFPKEQTSLHVAAYWGLEYILWTLLGQAVDIDSQDSWERTALGWAVNKMHINVAALLLEWGASPNSGDTVKMDVVQAEDGGHKFLELLIKLGIDVNLEDEDGSLLHIAARCGNDNLVLLLLDGGAKIDSEDSGGETALEIAAGCGNDNLVSLLLDRGAHIGSENSSGGLALCSAAEEGHESTTKLLLQHGADVNARLGKATPLILAAREGHVAVVRLLLESGADLSPLEDGSTVLHLAAIYGHEDVMQLLLENGNINPNFVDRLGRTPLWCAAISGHKEAVRLLLEQNCVESHSKDWLGMAQLLEAGRSGCIEGISDLLKQGSVDPNLRDINGRTPLLSASRNGHEALVELLVDQDDVDLEMADSGQTPLSLAAEEGHQGVVRLLLEQKKVEPDSKDNNGQTPLYHAAQEGHEEVVELLLKQNRVDPDSKNDEAGRTPLSAAASKGSESVVRLLLNEKTVNPDSRSKSGWTPLSYAAFNGHDAVVKLLLKQPNVDIEYKVEGEGTPLWWAVRGRQIAVVRALLQEGANPNTSNDEGWTAMHYAEKSGNETMRRLLLENGAHPVTEREIAIRTPPILLSELMDKNFRNFFL